MKNHTRNSARTAYFLKTLEGKILSSLSECYKNEKYNCRKAYSCVSYIAQRRLKGLLETIGELYLYGKYISIICRNRK